jgi:hemerythrin-like domain-containing protein
MPPGVEHASIMFDPIQAWHEEHMYFRRLLRLLQQEVDIFAAGDTPNYQLMLDIIAYLRDWGDHYHHPREDEAFKRIIRKRGDRELPIRRLMQEHRVVARAGEQLERMLEEVEADAIISRAQVEVAAATYLVYYGNHISVEEEDILPLAAEVLTEADWKAVKEVSVPGHHPEFGADPLERFRELRHRIEMEA